MKLGLLKVLMSNLLFWGFIYGIAGVGWDFVGLPWHLPYFIYLIFAIAQVILVVVLMVLKPWTSEEKEGEK